MISVHSDWSLVHDIRIPKHNLPRCAPNKPLLLASALNQLPGFAPDRLLGSVIVKHIVFKVGTADPVGGGSNDLLLAGSENFAILWQRQSPRLSAGRTERG